MAQFRFDGAPNQDNTSRVVTNNQFEATVANEGSLYLKPTAVNTTVFVHYDTALQISFPNASLYIGDKVTLILLGNGGSLSWDGYVDSIQFTLVAGYAIINLISVNEGWVVESFNDKVTYGR